MAEQNQDLQQEPSAADITEAKEMGWVPEEEFRGDKSKWIDAGTFLARGRDVMPLLRKNNQRLRDERKLDKDKIKELEQRLTDGEESVKGLLEFHKENLASKVKEARKVLLGQITEAKDSEDPEALGKAIAELSAFDVDQAVAGVKAAPKKNGAAPVEDEEEEAAPAKVETWFHDWLGENSWANQDSPDFNARKTRMANVISGELRADPKHKNLKGAAFLDKVAELTEIELGGRAQGRVEEGGRPGDSSGGNGHSFNDLPKEAKDTARRQTPKMVGAGKAFKSEKDWFKHYADTFFA